jgi:hypothetical protein
MDEFDEEGEVDEDIDMSTTTMDRPNGGTLMVGLGPCGLQDGSSLD